jgi:hypothetical protein
VLHGGEHPLRQEDLPGPGFRAQPGGQVDDRADRRVVQAPLEANGADGRVADGNADAVIQLVSALEPLLAEGGSSTRPQRSSSRRRRATRSALGRGPDGAAAGAATELSVAAACGGRCTVYRVREEDPNAEDMGSVGPPWLIASVRSSAAFPCSRRSPSSDRPAPRREPGTGYRADVGAPRPW